MDPAEFKAWRKSLGLKQKEAAEKLGLKKRIKKLIRRRAAERSSSPSTEPAA